MRSTLEENEDDENFCKYCDGEGRIEMDNNGPIADCPVCKGSGLTPPNVKLTGSAQLETLPKE